MRGSPAALGEEDVAFDDGHEAVVGLPLLARQFDLAQGYLAHKKQPRLRTLQ